MRPKLNRMRVRALFQYDWSSEIYGLGKSYREALKFPSFSPLLFFSDHGVNIDAPNIPEHMRERNFLPKLLLTWNHRIYNDKKLQSEYWKKYHIKILFVEHPWVLYRKRKSYEPKLDRQGTIFFPMHTVPGYSVSGFEDLDSIDFLKSLNKDHNPITVCLHMHDFETHRKSQFADAGFKVISMGNSSDYDYVDKFYLTISQFKFAISEGFGSQVAYLAEFGIPTQIIPRKIDVSLLGKKQLEESYHQVEAEIADYFREDTFSVREEQRIIANILLGEKFGFNFRVKIIIWIHFILIGITWIVLIRFPKIVLKVLRDIFHARTPNQTE